MKARLLSYSLHGSETAQRAAQALEKLGYECLRYAPEKYIGDTGALPLETTAYG